jgi:hypothetical protein
MVTKRFLLAENELVSKRLLISGTENYPAGKIRKIINKSALGFQLNDIYITKKWPVDFTGEL